MFRSLAMVLVLLLMLPATATAAEGPPLRVPPGKLAAALHCAPGTVDRDPILLVPGTTQTPEEFVWNYARAFTAKGWPYCTITLPDNGMDDIQVAAEYVVHAIRTVSVGRKVDIVGHSQGGMVPRWALKYWPDTRGMAGDLVGLAPSNHGTLLADVLCVPGCAPSFWQQRSQSAFMKALNTGPETWAGVDYTNVYTALDEVVTPNFDDNGSSALHTGDGRISNAGLQEVCPLRVADHITTGTADAVAYALTIDALTHDGPADPARVSHAVCGELLTPHVDPVSLPLNLANATTTIATQTALYPHTPAEPPLAPYAS